MFGPPFVGVQSYRPEGIPFLWPNPSGKRLFKVDVSFECHSNQTLPVLHADTPCIGLWIPRPIFFPISGSGVSRFCRIKFNSRICFCGRRPLEFLVDSSEEFMKIPDVDSF
jgi:hypothetical protein